MKHIICLPETEFKKLVKKILRTELRKSINRNKAHFNKELETVKKTQSIIDNSISEIKSTLEAKNSRLNDTEECISDLEDRIMEITQSEQQKDI